MVMKKICRTIMSAFLIFSLIGCAGSPGTVLSMDKLEDLEDGYVCEYRVGIDRIDTESLQKLTEQRLIDIDYEFDKKMFLDLYNEKENSQYNPVWLRSHIEECDLKLESGSEEDRQMRDSQVAIRAAYEDSYKEVCVYTYEGDLYFFVLQMGGRTEPEKKGVYYMRVSEGLQEYWKQVTSQIYNISP